MNKNIAVNLMLLYLFQYTGLIAAGLGMAAVGFVGEYLSCWFGFFNMCEFEWQCRQLYYQIEALIYGNSLQS